MFPVARRSGIGTGGPSGMTPSSLTIVADLGSLKAYRVNEMSTRGLNAWSISITTQQNKM